MFQFILHIILLKVSRSEYDNQGLLRREGDVVKNGC